jgi:nucleoside-diphosphate-sugar epimerase
VNIVRIDGELRSLCHLAAGHDLLVDAGAPYLLEMCTPGSEQWRAQVDAAVARTEIVTDAARRNGLRLAFVSSYATVPRHDLTETATAAALWRRFACPYFEAKIAMENVVLTAAKQGLPAVIVNPVAFVGPWEFRDRDWSFVPLLLSGGLPVVLDQPICVIDVRDVAELMDRAMEREAFGRPIPLAGHNIQLRDLAMCTARIAGVALPPLIAISGFMASAGAFWTHMAFTGVGMASPGILGLAAISPEVMPVYPSAEQIAFGVSLRPLEASLRDSATFHRSRQLAHRSDRTPA